MKLNLRVFLTVAFTLTATVPVIYLALWVERTALESELETVREKHLLLAKNITAALERYAADLESTFNYLIEAGDGLGKPLPAAAEVLARKFSIDCLVIVTFGDGAPATRAVLMPEGARAPFPARLYEILRAAENSATHFSPVMAGQGGDPMLFIYRRLTTDRVAVAAVAPTYFIRLQKAISFGRKGHAVIVDQAGRVIAHPNPEWQHGMKDLSGVYPVARMVAGETGVAPFFSPALESDMISGYTTVKGTGWGVMVPQPVDELQERAAVVFRYALAVGLAGMASALLLGWLISGALSAKLRDVVTATRKVRDGDLSARIGVQPRWAPEEVRELSEAFDRMADQLQTDKEVMAAALKDARNADLAKSEFLAHMSHELRTPLNAILGFSAMIGKSMGSPDKLAEYGQDIFQSGSHLLAVINDILNISTIEAGRLTFQDQPTRIDDIINAAIRLLRQQAVAAEVTIDVRLAKNLPQLVVDPVKQRQVLVNLLSNSLKFTQSPGRITLTADCDADGGVVISVRDNGIGMSEAEIVTALTPFGQIAHGRTGHHEGTGLGLPLSKSFVELQGGMFSISSAPGEGTEVLIRFPATKVQYAAV